MYAETAIRTRNRFLSPVLLVVVDMTHIAGSVAYSVSAPRSNLDACAFSLSAGMAASKQATSEDCNLQPATSAQSDAPSDNGVLDDSATMSSSSQDSSINDEDKNGDKPQATKEVDEESVAVHKTEQVLS